MTVVDEFKGQNLKNDILASVVVFLVAIPLCLGIALAVKVPPIVGIMTGVIGGIIVGLISESRYSVSGPAAGMIAVVLAAFQQLGTYEAFLLALFLAGLLQIIAGSLRAGFIANYVPSNVIKGLLTAIGILIIIKQLPLAFGYYADEGSLQTSLEMAEETLSLKMFTVLLSHLHAGVTLITCVSLVILILWNKYLEKISKILPASVVVVLVAVGINELFNHFSSALALGSSHLVNIPSDHHIKTFIAQFKHPSFSSWQNPDVYLIAVTIAIVASLETLLNLEAVEQLDAQHRYCSRNRELVAQGVGNTLAGLMGCLPITSVIVRSSVNINAGATSKRSAIFHGILLLLSITMIAEALNRIPIAALSAILIYTGYKLASYTMIKEIYAEGGRYFIPFVVTVLAIIFTNLLLGILVGLSVSALFILWDHSNNGYTIVEEMHPAGKLYRFLLPQQVTFLNKAAIIEGLNDLPASSKVIIDASNAEYIDDDILGVIKQFEKHQANDKGILLNLEGFSDKYDIAKHYDFINVTTYDVQAAITRETILKILREGNHRFVNNRPIHKNYRQQVLATAVGQHPIAVVLSCMDSRVPVEVIFDVNVGDLFVIRIGGNIVNEDIIGSIEYACKVMGAKYILVIGHKACGAIRAACEDVKMGAITHLLSKIKPALMKAQAESKDKTVTEEKFIQQVTRLNIENSKRELYEKSPILRELIDTDAVGIIGALYDVKTGKVEFEPSSTT